MRLKIIQWLKSSAEFYVLISAAICLGVVFFVCLEVFTIYIVETAMNNRINANMLGRKQ